MKHDTEENLVEIKRQLNYDPITGVITWRVEKSGARNHVAGNVEASGYYVVKVNGISMKAHRVAWALFFGVWPTGEIDHIDGNRKNNKISNLRDVTRSQNMMNCGVQLRSKSGVRGVTWHKQCGKWRADIRIEYRLVYLGLFDTVEEAKAAREQAEQKFFGEFTRTANAQTH